jgi:hypothetical protein
VRRMTESWLGPELDLRIIGYPRWSLSRFCGALGAFVGVVGCDSLSRMGGDETRFGTRFICWPYASRGNPLGP